MTSIPKLDVWEHVSAEIFQAHPDLRVTFDGWNMMIKRLRGIGWRGLVIP